MKTEAQNTARAVNDAHSAIVNDAHSAAVNTLNLATENAKRRGINALTLRDELSALNEEVMSNPTADSKRASAINGAVNSLNRANAQAAAYQSRLDNLNAQAADSKQKNWVGYMKALKALPQQMANSGINGGNTESSLVRLNAAYGTANNEVDRQTLPDRTALAAQVKAARATAEAARKRVSAAGGNSYVTNAYGNILNNAQQAELNSMIRRLSTLGYTDSQVQSLLQKAGF